MKKLLVILMIVVAFAGCEAKIPAQGNSQVSSVNTEDTEYQPELFGPYKCSYVYDGDTICVLIDGEEHKVRLIGVDTQESVASQEYLDKSGKENTEEGKIASDFTKQLLKNQYVYLEFDAQSEDDYGRLLAYVYLEDRVTMVQELLLSSGYAQTMTIQPNSKYAEHFAGLQHIAVDNGEGFWG